MYNAKYPYGVLRKLEPAKVPPMVLHIPHASKVIPRDVRGSFLADEASLELELLRMTDHYTDDIYELPVEAAAMVVYSVSRLVCDPERFYSDHDEPMAARGMGAIYTKRHDLGPLREAPSPREREALLERFYRPHHRVLEDAVSKSLASHGRCLVIDCHSFPGVALPYESDPDARPDICIGTDQFHTPDALRDAAVGAFALAGLSVQVNRPFSGALVPASRYRRDRRVSAIMIELNRRLYMDEASGLQAPEFLRIKALVGSVIVSDLSRGIYR